MSQEHGWTLHEVADAIQRERRAEADRYRLARAVMGPKPSPKALLANALRSLASLLDGEMQTQTQPNRRLARAA
jgi:hypothetical protein